MSDSDLSAITALDDDALANAITMLSAAAANLRECVARLKDASSPADICYIIPLILRIGEQPLAICPACLGYFDADRPGNQRLLDAVRADYPGHAWHRVTAVIVTDPETGARDVHPVWAQAGTVELPVMSDYTRDELNKGLRRWLRFMQKELSLANTEQAARTEQARQRQTVCAPPAPSTEQINPAVRAIALMHDAWRNGRTMTVDELADSVGCSKATLYRDNQFKAARQAMKAGGATARPRGYKDAAGNVEAFDDDD